MTGERRPGFINAEDASNELAKKLEDKHCLMVIDDVWDSAPLRWFLRGGKQCTRLITTRLAEIAIDAGAQEIRVDGMTTGEAAAMLAKAVVPHPSDLQPYRALAARLGEWPQLIELARGQLRHRLSLGYKPERALAHLEQAYTLKGLGAFDRKKPEDRRQAVRKTVEVSLELLLPPPLRERYFELSIFPEDTAIPLSAAQALWNLDAFQTDEIAQQLDNLSLLRFDLQQGTLRVHDVMRAYMAERLQGIAPPGSVHGRLIDAWGDPHCLPDEYAWRWYAYHLRGAGRANGLRKLLLDFNWLQAKLDATDITALTADYDPPVVRLKSGRSHSADVFPSTAEIGQRSTSISFQRNSLAPWTGSFCERSPRRSHRVGKTLNRNTSTLQAA